MLEAWLPAELPLFWAVALTVLSFFTSAMTAAFGIGGGVALITVLLLILPPASVLPVHGVVQAGSNASRTWIMRESVRWSIARWFAVGAVIGVILASMIVVALPQRLLQAVLAVFILWSIWSPGIRKRAIADKGFVAVGAVATFLTMFVGATGPLVAAFWRVEALGRQGVVATHGAWMTVQHTLKVIAFGWLGFAFQDWLPVIVAMVAAGYLGTMAGKKILARLPEALFARLFKWTLTILALRLGFAAAFPGI